MFTSLNNVDGCNDHVMEEELMQRSIRKPGTVFFPPATTKRVVRRYERNFIKRKPTQWSHGVAQRDKVTEEETLHHATKCADGTYYRLFALDGSLYRIDGMVHIGCTNGEDPALCRITSLWVDHDGKKMMELQQGDEDEERDEVEIEGLLSLSKPGSEAAKQVSVPELSPPKLARTRSNDEPIVWSVSRYEGHLLDCDWTVNEWMSDGPGDTGDGETKALVNCDNGKRVRSYSSWKLSRREFMADFQLSRIEEERKQYQREKAAKAQADTVAKAKARDAVMEAFGKKLPEASGKKKMLSQAAGKTAATQSPPPKAAKPLTKSPPPKAAILVPLPKPPPPPPPKAAKPPQKPKTYHAAVVTVIATHGLLSRAALAKECAAAGFDKAAQLKLALAKVIREGKVHLSGGSYILGAKERAAAGATYEEMLERATNARADKKADKEASRSRAEAMYASNLANAGGLSARAKSDRAWLQSIYGDRY